jgi:DNA invertase Pin-like site-specific DNA recombinase
MFREIGAFQEGRLQARAPAPKPIGDIKRLAAEGKSVRQIANELGISRSTSHRHMRPA